MCQILASAADARIYAVPRDSLYIMHDWNRVVIFPEKKYIAEVLILRVHAIILWNFMLSSPSQLGGTAWMHDN